ncbi:Veg family protein [Thermoanaerobacterium sp. RBIITD]|uniref:Veg family protein n=1 Tax=Thermoanaerobacterium sp. RBIITD TaxID=1550240 RepID=UPI0015619A8B|nr:Veg family protein [Thermoanaerobacterium sp. RBIITD]
MKLADRLALHEIKKKLDDHVGARVRLKTNGGRKKTIIREGFLEKTYPSIFIIVIDGQGATRRVSYSYSDILTDTVELTLMKDEKEIQCM